MKRYIARHYDGPDNGLDYGLEVEDLAGETEAGELAGYLTEPQAKVMAFALNASANGFKLLAYRTNGQYGGGEGLTIHRPFQQYDGPTEAGEQ